MRGRLRKLAVGALLAASGCGLGRLEQHGAPATPYDLVIVPGCPSNPDGSPSRCQLARAIWATLLWERGYVGTSPRAILDRAGVGQGSLYHHFDGKPAIALAAVEASAAELTAKAEEQLSRPGTAVERVTRGALDVNAQRGLVQQFLATNGAVGGGSVRPDPTR